MDFRDDLAGTEALRVAVVIPQHGAGGMFGPSCIAAARLAVDELNADGGVLGRALVPVFFDGAGPDDPSLDLLSEQVWAGRIHAVTGWHISSVRNSVMERIGGLVPYVYPALWEGGRHQVGLYCIGETPGQQVLPALDWFVQEAGVRRWFIAGNDYVWPRKTAAYAVSRARRAGIRIVGQRFMPLGTAEDDDRAAETIEAMLRAIARSRADAVLLLFIGLDGAVFNRAFAERGLDESVLRFGLAMDETVLMASGPDATGGLCTASSYFSSLASQAAADFRRRYDRLYGSQAPQLNMMAESTYESIQVLAHLATVARSVGVPSIEAVFRRGVHHEGPRGLVAMGDGGVRQPVRLGVANGLDFDVIGDI